MSLILEALRKSEAERRRGPAPDVATELPPLPMARTRPLPGWLLPAVLLTAMVLLAAWWWSQRDVSIGAQPVGPAAATPMRPPRTEVPAQPVVIHRPAATTVVAVPPVATSPALPVPVATLPPTTPASVPPAAQPRPPAPPASVATANTTDIANIDAVPIPPVKLSMHIWDESPARRFVILDGQRMGEGDRSGDLRVVAIERDGVIVERNGARARVPLP